MIIKLSLVACSEAWHFSLVRNSWHVTETNIGHIPCVNDDCSKSWTK